MCNWISVEESLPEFGDNVLASVDGQLKIMCYSEFEGGVWCEVYDGLDGYGYFDDEYNVTHWMPLPEPVKI
jgi:hypothetical protein